MPLWFWDTPLFETPDSEECGKKLYYVATKSTLLGIGFGLNHVVNIETIAGYVPAAFRVGQIVLPFATGGIAGAVAICNVATFRKKDDYVNWMYGGLAGGMVVGLTKIKGNFGHGLIGGFCGSLLLGMLKLATQNGSVPLLDEERLSRIHIDDFWTKDYRWTVVADRPKPWKAVDSEK